MLRPSQRKTPSELLKLPLFEKLLEQDEKIKEEKMYKNLIEKKTDDLYYLWQLAGGEINIELKKQGLIRSRPPMLSLPK